MKFQPVNIDTFLGLKKGQAEVSLYNMKTTKMVSMGEQNESRFKFDLLINMFIIFASQ